MDNKGIAGAGPAQPSGEGTVTLVSDETFIEEVLKSDAPVLVDFKAEWCGPCKMMAPIFAELAPEYADRVKFAKLDVDESPEVAGALEIQSIPTLMLFYHNTLLNAGVGAMRREDLRAWIDEGLSRKEMVDQHPEWLEEAQPGSEPETV